ncbi:disease resistance protein Roq1-like [Lycium ferocissimum]|uniref:disease resistance protein Roq1-like n=1 Tax=Lycium ferocissimum TaxID=112874 RepID=UPI002816466E|nr:disease resistance protein Roq1-like [Lycium ferocissimum]
MASQIQSVQKRKYDAFLNFRRQDFEGSFVADLYKRLEGIGIHAFKHDFELESREPIISKEILEAIEESRIAITIFSLDYASSTCCLEELTKIMKCVDHNKGQESFLVFYKVEPSYVLRPIGTFAVALAKHEADLKGTDLEKVQRWKDALHKAADMAGLKDYFSGAELARWS